MRVCYFGTYRDEYTRNQILIAGLRAQGVTVLECHATLWQGVADRVALAGGGWRSRRFWGRVARAYGQLWRRYRELPEYDVMVVGYPGQIDVNFGRILTWLRRKPLVLDILMSIHLVAEERGLTAQSPFTGRLLFHLERWGLRLPDRLIMENTAYRQYISHKYRLPVARFRTLPHGANDTLYTPRPSRQTSDTFRVVYFGSFLPSHGMPTIMGAAERLRDRPNIEFHLYGDGPEKAACLAQAQAAGLTRVIFHGFVEQDTLLQGIADAGVCLGVFGATPQALMTVQNKVWETLAMGRPLISADSPAIREALEDQTHLVLVPRQDPDALAAALLALLAQPAEREAMAQRGHQYFLEHNATQALGARFKAVLEEVVAESRG